MDLRVHLELNSTNGRHAEVVGEEVLA